MSKKAELASETERKSPHWAKCYQQNSHDVQHHKQVQASIVLPWDNAEEKCT